MNKTKYGLCYFMNHGSCKLQPGKVCDKCTDKNVHYIYQDPTNLGGKPGRAKRKLIPAKGGTTQ